MQDRSPAHPAVVGRSLFDVVLAPYRSLSLSAFSTLMGFIVLVCLSLGTAFLIIGAWPVSGFLGLEIVLVYAAFKASYRSGRLSETLRLSGDTLTVRRISPRGRVQTWRFQPHWLRVEMDDPPDHDSQLTLTSHGRRLIVGSFLTPQERLELARALLAALKKLRSVPVSV